jgi:hypothetical protein
MPELNPPEENGDAFLFGNAEEAVEGGLVEKRVAAGEEHAVEIARRGLQVRGLAKEVVALTWYVAGREEVLKRL